MIRIYHARILTMQEDQEIFDGEIWISDHKIQYVGPRIKKKRQRSHGRDRLMQRQSDHAWI